MCFDSPIVYLRGFSWWTLQCAGLGRACARSGRPCARHDAAAAPGICCTRHAPRSSCRPRSRCAPQLQQHCISHSQSWLVWKSLHICAASMQLLTHGAINLLHALHISEMGRVAYMHALLNVIKLVCKPMPAVVLSRCPTSCIGPAPRNAPATLQPGGRPPKAGRSPAVLSPPGHAPAWHASPRSMLLSNSFPKSACPSRARKSLRLCVVRIYFHSAAVIMRKRDI